MAKTEAVAGEQAAADGGRNGHDDDLAKFEQDLADYLQERIKPGLNSGAIPLLARSIAKDLAHRSAFNSESEDAEVEDEPDAEAEEEPTSEADDEPSADAAEEESDAEAEDEPDAEVDAEADDEPEAEAEDEFDAEADDEPEAEADDEPDAEADDEPEPEADDEPEPEADDESLDFEDEMHQLQAELGEEWILRFSVHGGDAWLTAEKDDGSQRLEAPTADVLAQAVGLLNQGGGRST